VAAAIAGCDTIVNAVQFDGYPVENPRRGLTFERIDYGGTVALVEAAETAGVANFIYISGAAADENSTHPGFRAKGRAESVIRESGLSFAIFRPSLVYGPGDKVVGRLAKALRFAPLMIVPGSGQQKLQPVLVDDVAACVALAIGGIGRGGIFEVGGPDLMSFDDLVRIVMEITGRRRPIIHVPEGILRIAGAVAEKMPGAIFSRDAVAFLVADNACDIAPLVAEFGIRLTPIREGLAYLARK
jgi:NADH dehydrogenase